MSVVEMKEETRLALDLLDADDLATAHDFIEDLLDRQAVAEFQARRAAGRARLTPWEAVRTRIDRRLQAA